MRKIHSAVFQGFCPGEQVTVLPITTAEHTDIHPFSLFIGTDEHCSYGISDLAHPVPVGKIPVKRVESLAFKGLHNPCGTSARIRRGTVSSCQVQGQNQPEARVSAPRQEGPETHVVDESRMTNERPDNEFRKTGYRQTPLVRLFIV